MKRHLVATALAVACTALLAAPANAGLPPTSSSAVDPAGDVASKSLDITKASIKPLGGGAYKGAVRYTDLKISKSTRRIFSVTTYSVPTFPRGERPLIATSTWTLELRTTPDGKVVSKYWKNGSVATCAGAKASANYQENKISFVFPEACIGPFGFGTSGTTKAWKQPSGVPWSPTTLDVPPGAAVDNLDGSLLVS